MTMTWTDPFVEPRSWSPSLDESEVHVWAIGLSSGPNSQQTLLSPDELETAQRLRFVEDRQRYVAARGSLRQILAGYVGATPTQLRFRYGDRGKPHLEDHARLEFNLSHSGNVALLAVSRLASVGVDVEKQRPLEDLLGLARRNFAPGEYATLTGLPESERLDSFFRCWTRKEAYVKAVGDGLALPLSEFEVTCAPGEPARFLSLGGSQSEARSWYLHSLRPAAGYVGALVLRGQPQTLETWIWRHPRASAS